MARKGLLRIAAVLMIAAGALNIIWAVIAITGIVDTGEVLRSSWAISPLPYFGVAAGFTGRTGLSNVLAVAYFAGILAAVAGGIIFLYKNTVISLLTGMVGAVLCFPLLGIASIALALLPAPRSTG